MCVLTKETFCRSLSVPAARLTSYICFWAQLWVERGRGKEGIPEVLADMLYRNSKKKKKKEKKIVRMTSNSRKKVFFIVPTFCHMQKHKHENCERGGEEKGERRRRRRRRRRGRRGRRRRRKHNYPHRLMVGEVVQRSPPTHHTVYLHKVSAAPAG